MRESLEPGVEVEGGSEGDGSEGVVRVGKRVTCIRGDGDADKADEEQRGKGNLYLFYLAIHLYTHSCDIFRFPVRT